MENRRRIVRREPGPHVLDHGWCLRDDFVDDGIHVFAETALLGGHVEVATSDLDESVVFLRASQRHGELEFARVQLVLTWSGNGPRRYHVVERCQAIAPLRE